MRQALVVGQVALSLVLLVSAGFVLRSLQAVSQLDPGFVAENHLVAHLDLESGELARRQHALASLWVRQSATSGV